MAWIQAAAFPLNNNLSRFNQLLIRENIPHRFVEESGKQILWVDSQDSAQKAQLILQQLRDGALETERSSRDAIDAGSDTRRWVGRIDLTQCPVTLITIALSVIGYIVGDWLFESSFHSVLSLYALDSITMPTLENVLFSGEIWRLITPAFLHFSAPHILMNAVLFYFVGQRLESYLKPKLYISLLLLLAFSSNIAEYQWSNTIYFGGLSGVVFGCFGFVGSLYIKIPDPVLEMPRGFFLSIFFGLFIGMSGLLDILFDIKIGNASHLGGFIVGIVLGTFFGDYKLKRMTKSM